MRSESLYIAPTISDKLVQTVSKQQRKGKIDHSIHLKERGMLRHLIQAGEISKAKELMQNELAEIYHSSLQIRGMLDALEFINLLDSGDLAGAIKFSVEQLSTYRNDKSNIYIPTQDLSSTNQTLNILNLTALLCYAEPRESELAFILSNEQRIIILDAINNEILSKEYTNHLFRAFE